MGTRSEGTSGKGGLLGQEGHRDDTPRQGPGGAPRPPEQKDGEFVSRAGGSGLDGMTFEYLQSALKS